MNIQLNHIAIRCTDLEVMKKFFINIFDFTIGFRPSFGFDGYWLYANDKSIAILHLMDRGDKAEDINVEPNIIDHFALTCDDYDLIISNAKKHNIQYSEVMVPDTKILQVFFKAPEGLKVEADFLVN